MNISFLCGSGGPAYDWADPSVEQGIGGSEECLIYLARALVRAGHRVRVYNKCGALAGIYHGVTYIPSFVNPYPDEDLLVAWRDWTLLINKEAKQRWMWSHDQPVGCHAPSLEAMPIAEKWVDRWMLLNPSHARRYDMLPGLKISIVPIAVEEQGDPEIKVERVRGRVIYFSEPARGLYELWQMWGEVRRRVPFATLAAFWWDESKFLPSAEEIGILPMRKLGPKEVSIECRRASVWGYPCNFDGEIAPAVAIKAQLGGAVPCVIAKGGLKDMVKMGVTTDKAHFIDALCNLLIDENRQFNMRQTMLKVMSSWWTWDEVAARWSKILENSFVKV